MNSGEIELDFYLWCKQQTELYWKGELSECRIRSLEAVGFDWDFLNENKD